MTELFFTVLVDIILFFLVSRELPPFLEGNPLTFPYIPTKEKCSSEDTIADEIVCGDWEWKDYVKEKKNDKRLHINSLANKNISISLLNVMFFITSIYFISCYIEKINTGGKLSVLNKQGLFLVLKSCFSYTFIKMNVEIFYSLTIPSLVRTCF